MTDGSPVVVVAVDKFKGSASAYDAGRALARGLLSTSPCVEVVQVPVADGGDGSLEALLTAGFHSVTTTARGPLGHPRRTRFGRRGSEAFVELAEICGIQLLPVGVLRPWSSGTYGLGQVMLAAVDQGVRRITVGLGGSASTDGGLGMLVALGATGYDASGRAVSPDAFGMARVTSIDLSTLDPRLASVEFVVATDVRNPLTGPEGAARVFAPQKGAHSLDVALLEAALERWSTRLLAASGRPADVAGAGAAGGVAASIVTALNGTITSGAALVLDAVGFDEALSHASLVITGEGSWDAQTDSGKAPRQVLERAAARGVPVTVVAGQLSTGVEAAEEAVVSTHALLDLEPDRERAMAGALELLERVGREIGRDLVRVRSHTP